MKKLLTGAFLIFLTLQLGAQSKEAIALQKSYDKVKNEVVDAKKGSNPTTWVKYAKVLTDAYGLPTSSLWVGLSSLEAKVVLKDQKALSTEYQTVQGEEYEVVKYDDKDLYYNQEGKLSFWKITKPVLQDVDMLKEAQKAYVKAAELDNKGSQKKAIQEGLTALSNNYINDAMTAYSLGEFAISSQYFEEANTCTTHPAVGTIDTTVVYYAGLTAQMAKDYERSSQFFKKCIDMGYGQNGDAYANMADACKQLGDIEAAKTYLSEGFTKYPNSQSILVALINTYIESNDDPNKVLNFIHKAQENEPNNPSLFYAEGNVHKNLGDFDKAMECYNKSTEIDPNYFYGYFSKGVAYYDKAVEIQTQASDELDDAKYMKLIEQLDATLDSAIAPFESCLGALTDDEFKPVVVEYLKNIFFRLRSKSPEYEASYEKYNKMFLGEE